jgi:hypothetical protein
MVDTGYSVQESWVRVSDEQTCHAHARAREREGAVRCAPFFCHSIVMNPCKPADARGKSLAKWHIDHLIPCSPSSGGCGLNHVANYFIMIDEENEYFSDRPELAKAKLECVGGVSCLVLCECLAAASHLCVPVSHL